MAFIAASASFTRYKIVEDVPQDLWAQIPERLKKHAFREIDHCADERSWGWTCFDNMLDMEWRTAPPEKGAYLAFSFRLDTRRVAPAIYKKYVQMAFEEAEQKVKEEGRKFLPRDQKTEIREQIKLKLMARTLPVPAVFDVAWNMEENLIFFDSTRSNLCDMFIEHFGLTFELNLEPLTPYFLALRTLGKDYEEMLDNMDSTDFVV